MTDDGYVFDNPELQALEEQYGAGYVITAFNVQDKIRREGIEGIRFMGKTENYLKRTAPMVTKRKLDSNVRSELTKRGLR